MSRVGRPLAPEEQATQAWIRACGDEAVGEVLVDFAYCMNTRSWDLEAVMAANVRHESQVRREPIVGRNEVLGLFLRSGSPSDGPRRDFAELSMGPPSLPVLGPCMLSHYRDSLFGRPGLGTPRSMITVQLDDAGMIERTFSTCIAPSPQFAERSGLFPGIGQDELDAERKWVGPALDRQEALELHLFCLPGLEGQLDAYLAEVREVASRLGLPAPSLEPMVESNELMWGAQVFAHPTLLLTYQGSRVLLIEGYRERGVLEGLLEEALVGAPW